MLSNLPPGLTGFEDAFGPRSERDFTDDRTCAECGVTHEEVVVTRTEWACAVIDYWDCPECGYGNEDEWND